MSFELSRLFSTVSPNQDAHPYHLAILKLVKILYDLLRYVLQLRCFSYRVK